MSSPSGRPDNQPLEHPATVNRRRQPEPAWERDVSHRLTRRSLGAAAAAVVGYGAWRTSHVALGQTAGADNPSSLAPSDALAALYDGNRRFVAGQPLAAHRDIERAVRENVRNQAQVLAESSPVIAKLVRQKELIVAGGVYDLASGIVTPVDVGL